MQILINRIRFWARNNHGSTLVTAVVFSFILAIGGIGFLLVTTHSSNNDSDAYLNDRALHAAESGALLASKWLMARTPANWSSGLPSDFDNISINGCYVQVTVTINGNLATIKSAAYKKPSPKDASNFIKRVVMKVQNG